MNTLKKYGPAALWGLLYAAVVIWLSRWLITGLGNFVGWIGDSVGLEQELQTHIALALSQLKDAQLLSPWLIGLLIGVSTGALLRLLISNRTVRIGICIAAGLLMLIPLTMAAVWFTQINGIYMGRFLQNLLPLISALL